MADPDTCSYKTDFKITVINLFKETEDKMDQTSQENFLTF